jgi:hypothetical protein
MAATDAAAETVRLKDGNVVRGKALSRTASEITVELPSTGTTTFLMTDVVSIQDDADSQEPFAHVVKLVNGNEIYGRVDEQTPQQVSVIIPGTGTLTFAAVEIASIEPLGAEQAAELNADLEQDAKAKSARASPSGRVLNRLSSLVGGNRQEDDMTQMEREVKQRKQQAQAQVDKAQSLVRKVHGEPTGLVKLPLAPSSARGAVSMPQLDENNPFVKLIKPMLATAVIWLPLMAIGIMIFYAVCLQHLAERTGTDGEWMAWVPLAHIYLAIRVGGCPGWWLLLYFVPLVSVIINILVWVGIARARDKSAWLGVVASIVPIANVFVIWHLAFGKDKQAVPPGIAPR